MNRSDPIAQLGLPDWLDDFATRAIWGNQTWAWIAAALTVLLVLTVAYVLIQKARRPPLAPGVWGDAEFAVGSMPRFPVFIIALDIGASWLSLPPTPTRVLFYLTVVAAGILVATAVAAFVRRLLDRHLRPEASASPDTPSSLGVLGTVAEILVWSVTGLLVLANLGVNVSGLIASLGVGGIAVALAAQNILGDLFASMSIILDKPFEPGDFILVGKELGVVKRVGLKTTRVQALQGEELVFSNTDLLNSRIQNFKRMQERRVVLEVGFVYSTPTEAIVEIPKLIQAAVEATDGARFDRAHFRSFGDSALVFEGVYYVDTPDFTLYMDRQQSINLHLLRAARERGLQFAFPSRSLYVESLPPVRTATEALAA